MVSAWPEPPFAMHVAIIAGAHDGMEALACATTTTESLFLSIRLASPSETEKRNRHVSFMDRAKRLDLSRCVVRGPRFGQHLGPFFDASSFNAKKKGRCLWLGNGVSYAQPSTLGTGMG